MSDFQFSPPSLPPENGIAIIARERARHVQEGFDADHDEEHDTGGLAMAAACYATPPWERDRRLTVGMRPVGWPWSADWWKPSPDDRVRELAKAGALIAAEIDRLLARGDA